ncbi:MAG: hypothetical protein NZ898_02810 [Myxococcota bacterium]|nr:hypothetical protein [Myxococcota bacterium]MDW8361304.1 hypothetical protein [Myxococcales bacterium]
MNARKSLTQRWYIEDGQLRVLSEPTREIRLLDMVPASRDEVASLADAMRYEHVSLSGARLYRSEDAEDPGIEGSRGADETGTYDASEIALTAGLRLPEPAWARGARSLLDRTRTACDRVLAAIVDHARAIGLRLEPQVRTLAARSSGWLRGPARDAAVRAAARIACLLRGDRPASARWLFGAAAMLVVLGLGGGLLAVAARSAGAASIQQRGIGSLIVTRVPVDARRGLTMPTAPVTPAPAVDLVFDEQGNVIGGAAAPIAPARPEPELSAAPVRSKARASSRRGRLARRR